MLSVFLTLLQAATVQVAPMPANRSVKLPTTVVDPADVTVVARRISDAKDALEACLRRKCPALEDIRLSSDYAQDQFIVGNYSGAYSTLYSSRRRNEQFSKQHPVEVSGLVQFQADMSVLTGYLYRARVGAIDSLDALKSGLAPGDRRIVAQRIIIGDGFVRQGRLQAGSDVYDLVAKQADAAGFQDLRGQALLRGASLYGYLAVNNASYSRTAERRFAQLEATQAPELQRYRDAAALLRSRLAYEQGDKASLERVIAGAERTKAPMLVISPTFDLHIPGCASTGSGFAGQDGEFVDVSFVIKADGTVTDVAEIRRGQSVRGNWPKRLIASVAERRYLPLVLVAGSSGLDQVERFSVVREIQATTGSRIGQACGVPRLEIVDLIEGEKQRSRSTQASAIARN